MTFRSLILLLSIWSFSPPSGFTDEDTPTVPLLVGSAVDSREIQKKCDRAKFYHDQILKHLTQDQRESIRTSTEQGILLLESRLKLNVTRYERKLLNQSLLDLKALHGASDSMEKRISQEFETLCLSIRKLGGRTLQIGSLSLLALGQVLIFPFKAAIQFGVGLLRRTPQVSTEPGPRTAEILGTENQRFGRWALGSYQLLRTLFWSGGPGMLAAMGLDAIDQETEALCHRSDLTDSEKKFCKDYHQIKQKHFEARKFVRNSGAKVAQGLLLAFDTRNDSALDPDFCHLPLPKQLKLTERAIERLHLRHTQLPRPLAYLETFRACFEIRWIFPDGTTLPEDLPRFEDGIAITPKFQTQHLNELRAHTFLIPPDLAEPSGVCEVALGRRLSKTHTRIHRRRGTGRASGTQIVAESILNPSRFTSLETIPLQTEAFRSRHEKDPLKPLIGKRAVFVLVGRTDPEVIREGIELLPEYRRLARRQKELEKLLESYADTGNFQKCLQQAQQRPFPIQELRALEATLPDLALALSVRQSQGFSKLANRTLKRLKRFSSLKLPWELVETDDWNELLELLKSPDVSHLLIAGHGTQNGQLVDSLSNRLPEQAFTNLSPTLQSVTLFMCHANPEERGNVTIGGREYPKAPGYPLVENLLKSPSFVHHRMVGYAENHRYYDASSSALSTALSEFLKATDREAQKLEAKNRVSVLASLKNLPIEDFPTPQCRLRIEGSFPKHGKYAVFMARRTIGFYDERTPRGREFTFPCSWLSDSRTAALVQTYLPGGIAAPPELAKSEALQLDFTLEEPNYTETRKRVLEKDIFLVKDQQVVNTLRVDF